MFGISFSEIILILLLALIIFGPEQLPGIARKLGNTFANLRRLRLNLRDQLYQHAGLEQFESIRQEMQHTIRELKQQLQPHNPLPQQNYPIQTDKLLATDSAAYGFASESDLLYHQFQFLHQPELDFTRQPELFDEL